MKVQEKIIKYSKSELIRLSAFLNSPYYGVHSELLILFNCIAYGSNEDIERLTWSKSKLAKIGHRLYKKTIEFDSVEYINTHPELAILLEYRANSEKNDSYASKKYDYAVQRINSEGRTTLYQLISKLIVDLTHKDLTGSSQKTLQSVHNSAFELKKYLDSLQLLEIENQNLLGHDIVINNQESKHPIISIFNITSSYIKTGEDHLFQLLINKIKENSNYKDDLKGVILILSNFLLIKIARLGKISHSNNLFLKHHQDLFDLYKVAISHSLVKIDVTQYRNFASVANRVKQYKWALEFIEKHKNHLPDHQRDSAYSFSKARTLWHARDYNGVIETLRDVDYEDIDYNLLTRTYLLTCYYELDEDEALDSLIKSFKVYLRRKRNISVKRKEAFYNFTTVIDLLMKARERGDKKRVIKAQEVIQENPSGLVDDWLLEKIEELETSLGVKRPTMDS